jgi:hypothetical protein
MNAPTQGRVPVFAGLSTHIQNLSLTEKKSFRANLFATIDFGAPFIRAGQHRSELRTSN